MIYYYYKGIFPKKIYHIDFDNTNWHIDNLTHIKPDMTITKELLDKLFIFDKEAGKFIIKLITGKEERC